MWVAARCTSMLLALIPSLPLAPSLPASPAAPRSSVSATRSCQSASSLYFHWIAVPLFRTSGSAVSIFAALLHPAASTMQSTKRAAQSAKSDPVSSFFPVFIFFPPFRIVYHGEAHPQQRPLSAAAEAPCSTAAGCCVFVFLFLATSVFVYICSVKSGDCNRAAE